MILLFFSDSLALVKPARVTLMHAEPLAYQKTFLRSLHADVVGRHSLDCEWLKRGEGQSEPEACGVNHNVQPVR